MAGMKRRFEFSVKAMLLLAFAVAVWAFIISAVGPRLIETLSWLEVAFLVCSCLLATALWKLVRKDWTARRHPQFSLRTILWLMAVVGVLCVIIAPAVKEYIDYVDAERVNWIFTPKAPTEKPPTWWWPWPR